MSSKRITFSTYLSLKNAFKEVCELNEKTMSQQITDITSSFLTQSISISQLEKSLTEFKENQKEKEIKSYKLAIMIDEELYATLKEKLEIVKIRPASFFCFAMAYSLNNTSVRQIYAHKAKKILEERKSETIKHVVFGLRYFKPITNKKNVSGTILIDTEYFIDICTDQRFEEYYNYPSPFLEVLAVHRK